MDPLSGDCNSPLIHLLFTLLFHRGYLDRFHLGFYAYNWMRMASDD